MSNRSPKTKNQASRKKATKAEGPVDAADKRPTEYLFDEVIELVIELIALRYKKFEMRQLAERALGFKLNMAQFQKLIAAAQGRMVQNVREDVEIHKARAHSFFEATIREAPEFRDKISAQKELAHLHNLYPSGKTNADQQQLSDDERAERVRQVLRQMHENTSGSGES